MGRLVSTETKERIQFRYITKICPYMHPVYLLPCNTEAGLSMSHTVTSVRMVNARYL